MKPDPHDSFGGRIVVPPAGAPPSLGPALTTEAALDYAQRNEHLSRENAALRIRVGALNAELTECKAVASWLLVILLAFIAGALLFAKYPSSRPGEQDAPAIRQEINHQGGTQR